MDEKPVFDWRQLRRWGFLEDKLPKSSRVLYKKFSFWEMYGRYVLAGLAVIIFQLTIILMLIFLTKKGRQRERQQKNSEERYKTFIQNSSETI